MRHLAGQIDDRGFGGAVAGIFRRGEQTEGRSGGDHVAAALFDELRQHGAWRRGTSRSNWYSRRSSIPRRCAHGFFCECRRRRCCKGYRPCRRYRPRVFTARSRSSCLVTSQLAKTASPPSFSLIKLIDARRNGLLNIAANDFRALAGEQARGGAADAAVGAGDNRNFAFETPQSGPQHVVFVFR